MGYYSSYQDANTQGVFLRYENGEFYFITDAKDEIVFDEINKHVLEKYDLKSNEFKGKNFQIFYTEIMDDLDDEDLIILRLDDLELL